MLMEMVSLIVCIMDNGEPWLGLVDLLIWRRKK